MFRVCVQVFNEEFEEKRKVGITQKRMWFCLYLEIDSFLSYLTTIFQLVLNVKVTVNVKLEYTWKEYGMAYLKYFPGRADKNTISLRICCVFIEIWIRDLQNRKQKC